MKKLIALLAVVGLTGCHSLKIGDASVKSFGQRTTIGKVTYNPETHELTVEGYNNDQVQGLNAVAEGVAKGIVAGMKP